MKGLLDTHTFIWWDGEPAKLSAAARTFITDPANSVYFSVVGVWEMIVKSQLGKLSLRSPLADILAEQQANGIQILSATVEHALELPSLPAHHKDPFDRLMIAQARSEGAVILSADAVFQQYPIAIVW